MMPKKNNRSQAFAFERFNLDGLPTPVHITDEILLEKNLHLLSHIQKKTGAKILLALKAFAQFSLFPLLRRYLAGTTVTSLFEARLAFEEFRNEGFGNEEFGNEIHACAPAYPPKDFEKILEYADYIIFNSFAQWRLFKDQIKNSADRTKAGIRVNPEHSEVKTSIYDPCAPSSRLGVRREDFLLEEINEIEELDGIGGLHFHTLCESGFLPLKRTWQSVEKKFGDVLPKLKWINMGGGHRFTHPDYDIEGLCRLILEIRKKYNGVAVYFEPGEAVTLNCGVLVTSVLDIVPSRECGFPTAILDISITAHIPDVLEMPYRPEVFSDGFWAQKTNEADSEKYPYHLAGLSCLAGDIMGDYSFPKPLAVGQKILLGDMAHYTMVKSSNFNGLRPPAIASGNTNTGKIRLIKYFEYEDYKKRLS